MKGKDYIVIEEKRLEDLIRRVNELLGEGYKPAGGISVACGGCYLQALVRRSV